MIHILLLYLPRIQAGQKILIVWIYIQYDNIMLIGSCIEIRIFVFMIDKYNLINKINRYNNLQFVNLLNVY